MEAEATEKAKAYSSSSGLPLVEAPAEDQDGVPICYGDFAPERHPCSPCAVRADCQMANLGID